MVQNWLQKGLNGADVLLILKSEEIVEKSVW